MMTDLTRWSPLDELRSLGDELERQLGQWSRPYRAAGIMPCVDVVTGEDGWRLRVALPGVSPENVEVNVTGQTVAIRAVEREGDTVTTRFEQTVALPDTVDVEKIAATFRNGLLELTLPLKEALKPRRIEISTEAPKQLATAA
jgi:HSP20 family protein